MEDAVKKIWDVSWFPQFNPHAFTSHLLGRGKLPSPSYHSWVPTGLLSGNTENRTGGEARVPAKKIGPDRTPDVPA
jgi:hypothetical protein